MEEKSNEKLLEKVPEKLDKKELKEIVSSETKQYLQFQPSATIEQKLQHIIDFNKKIDEKVNEIQLLQIEPKDSENDGEFKNSTGSCGTML